MGAVAHGRACGSRAVREPVGSELDGATVRARDPLVGRRRERGCPPRAFDRGLVVARARQRSVPAGQCAPPRGGRRRLTVAVRNPCRAGRPDLDRRRRRIHARDGGRVPRVLPREHARGQRADCDPARARPDPAGRPRSRRGDPRRRGGVLTLAPVPAPRRRCCGGARAARSRARRYREGEQAVRARHDAVRRR